MRGPDELIVIECEEYESIDLDPSLWVGEGHEMVFNSEINGRDVLRANFRKGKLQLQATSYVGVIPLNEQVVVRVRPRVPIANLTRMVVETGHDVMALSAFRDYTGRGTADDWAMDIYTDALLGYVDEVLDSGLLRAYERLYDEGHYPHGRIEVGATIQRFAARGAANTAAFSWHERTIDVPANRCIRAAMEVALAHLTKVRDHPRKGDRAKIARLAGQLHALEEVYDDPDHRFLDDELVLGTIPLPDARAYYRPVLDLAVLMVHGVGLALDLDLGSRDVQLGSLLIDTNKLFENFVRVSLSKQAVRGSWPIEVLDGNAEGKVDLYDIPDQPPSPLGVPMRALARRDRGKAQPDVVWRTLDGTVVLIAEVKNTAHGKNAQQDDVLPERGEVEQAVTYALRYGLDFAILVHPWIKGTKGMVYVGRVRSIDVFDYRLDLSSDEGIDESLEDMARTLMGVTRLEPIHDP